MGAIFVFALFFLIKQESQICRHAYYKYICHKHRMQCLGRETGFNIRLLGEIESF